LSALRTHLQKLRIYYAPIRNLDAQPTANTSREMLLDFLVSRDRSADAGGRIGVDRMARAFAKQLATARDGVV
jgi:hypothetical protein